MQRQPVGYVDDDIYISMLKESIHVSVIIITRMMLSIEHSPAVYVIMFIAD